MSGIQMANWPEDTIKRFAEMLETVLNQQDQVEALIKTNPEAAKAELRAAFRRKK